jgi:hypothetical protein
MLAKGANSG